MSVLYTFAFLSTFNWVTASKTVLCCSHPCWLTTFAAVKDALAVSTHFKLADTPLSNSTHGNTSPNDSNSPSCPLRLICVQFIISLSWWLLPVQFRLLLFTLSIFTFFFFNICICGNCSRHLIQISHMVAPNPQWLSLISLFRWTKSCCAT